MRKIILCEYIACLGLAFVSHKKAIFQVFHYIFLLPPIRIECSDKTNRDQILCAGLDFRLHKICKFTRVERNCMMILISISILKKRKLVFTRNDRSIDDISELETMENTSNVDTDQSQTATRKYLRVSSTQVIHCHHPSALKLPLQNILFICFPDQICIHIALICKLNGTLISGTSFGVKLSFNVSQKKSDKLQHDGA